MNKLLIIEDDVTIRNALRILLENQGYFIEEAHDGEEGLQKFDSTFDLLIIDIMMPNISGIEVCRRIREKSYVPILFLTAKSLETDKMEALSAGGDDYLVKPFSYVELIARIQALIRRCRVYDNADALDNEDMLPQEASVEDDYYYRNGLYFTSYDLKVLQGMTTSSNYITFKFSDRETYDTACHSLFEKGDYKYLIPTARGGTITYMQEPNSLAVFIHIELGS